MFTVVGIGEVLWDVYDGDRRLGGAPANFALHVRQLGHDGVVVSRVGRDELGRGILESLGRMGAPTEYIQEDGEHPTGTVRVFLDSQGRPTFSITPEVAYDYLEYTEPLKILAERADAVLFGSLAQRNPKARESIREFLRNARMALKVFDVNLRGWDQGTQEVVRESLKLTDLLKVNDDELKRLKELLGRPDEDTKAFFGRLMGEFPVRLVALTLGEKGCVLATPEEVVTAPAMDIAPVDTTGSGDAFAAGLVVGVLEGRPLEEVAESANGIGGFVATRKGAVPSYTPSEVEHFVRTTPKRRVTVNL